MKVLCSPHSQQQWGWVVHGLEQAYCTLHAAIALMLRWY